MSQRCDVGKAHHQVGAGPPEADRAEAALVERARALAEACDVLLPGRYRVGLVQARRRDDRLPEPLDVGLAEDRPGPPLVRVADDRPLDEPAVLRVEELLDGQPRPRPLGAALIEVGEQFRLGVPRDRDRRAACLDHVVDQRHGPGRAPVERVLGRVLDPRALQVRVAVVDLDEAGAPLVGDPPIARTSGKCSGSAEIRRNCPGWRLTATSTARRAYLSSRSVRRHKPKPYSLHVTCGARIAAAGQRGSFRAMLLSGITSLGKTVLLVVAITFIAWAIVTAIFVPKRSPRFPRRLDAYILVSVLLFVAQMTAVVWVTGTQEVEEAHASEAEGEPGATTGGAGRRLDGGGEGSVRERRLRDVSHARRRGRERLGGAEPRRDEAGPGARRRAGHERDGRHAARSRISSPRSRSKRSPRTSRRPPARRKDSVRDRLAAARGGEGSWRTTGPRACVDPDERGFHETIDRDGRRDRAGGRLRTSGPFRDRDAVRRRDASGGILTLVSNTGDAGAANDFSGASFSDTGVTTFASITTLSTEFDVTDDDCIAGSPRFRYVSRRLRVRRTYSSISVPTPSFTGCSQNVWVTSGNLIGSTEGRFDTSQVQAGTQVSTYAQALALVGTYPVTGISLVVDSGWALADKEQTVRIRNVKVNTSTFFAPEGPKPPGTGGLNPAQACKKLRSEMGTEAFRMAYGKNPNGANAFGKCVSKMARMKNDPARAAAVERIGDAADRCAERTTTDKGKGKAKGHAKSKSKGKGKLRSCLKQAV